MGIMEIILILLGIIVFAVSFLLPAGKKEDDQSTVQASEEAVREMVNKEVKNAKSQVGDIVNETINYAMEKSERTMERLTNEKIMAVNEYSDTVLSEINKNHKEVVFLYDMLNDKHESLKTTVSESLKVESEVRQILNDAEVTAREAESKAKEVRGALGEVVSNTMKAIEAAATQDKETGEPPAADVKEAGTEDKDTKKKNDNVKEKAKEKEDFTPITVKKLEVIQPSEEKEQKKGTGKGGRKTRVSKAVLKDVLMDVPEAEALKASLEDGAPVKAADGAVPEGEERTGNNNEKILELHKAGMSDVSIARELELGVGEVRLVIDLFEGN